jgi:DNA gyrase subunit A
MPLPEDEESWANLDVMFSTTRGTVRRNKLSDFVQVNRNGKIAMKLEEEGDEILSVETCNGPAPLVGDPGDDVLLTTALGQAIRFSVDEVRVFAGRNSIGVRGITLAENDRLISMTILGHVDAEAFERAAYLKRSAAERRALGVDEEDIQLVGEEVTEEGDITDERYTALKALEQFVLTVSDKGFGKRSSSYDFRISGRGGKGIRATDTSKTAEIGQLVAAFPVDEADQIMLVSDGGQLIRVPVNGIRIASRATKGVTIFSTAADEKVVSVERISEPEDEEGAEAEGEAGIEPSGTPEAEGPVEG